MRHIVVYIKTTNECQLRCEHCYNTISPFKGSMSEETADKVIEYLKEKSKDNIILATFHGGEPLFNGLKIINKIYNALKDNENIDFTITTNLMYNLTDEHIKLFKGFLYDENTSLISTSWDYKIRFQTKSQLQLWEMNVRKLIENNIKVAPIISVTKYLVNDVKPNQLFEYFKNMGIDYINFERITETGRAVQNDLRPSNKETNDWLYEAYKESLKYNFTVPLFNGLKEAIVNLNKTGCRKRECAKNVITINPDGNMAGCPNCSDKIYGNVDGSFNNEYYNELVREEQLKHNECYLCEYYQYCNGECYQLKWDETGCVGMKRIIEDIRNEK